MLNSLCMIDIKSENKAEENKSECTSLSRATQGFSLTSMSRPPIQLDDSSGKGFFLLKDGQAKR